MESMVVKLILIILCILYGIGYFDPETKESNKPFNTVNQKAKGSDPKSDFLGKEFWEDIDQMLCDYPELDETWKKPNASCFSIIRGYEETKIEVLSWSPPLVIYRDFFSNKQVAGYLRIFEEGTLEKQMINSPDGTSYSSTARIVDGLTTGASEFPEVQSLQDTASRLIPAINFEISEAIKGLKYDIKGHYAPHYDYIHVYKNSDMTGEDDRMVTFLMVLQAAKVGGGTIFPYLGTVARTRPGDAILWFNMKQNTELEPLSLHGGCPVRSGEKIIATILVESRGQELLKKFYEDKSFSADVLLR